MATTTEMISTGGRTAGLDIKTVPPKLPAERAARLRVLSEESTGNQRSTPIVQTTHRPHGGGFRPEFLRGSRMRWFILLIRRALPERGSRADRR
jgi:hypothetical protein